MCAATHRQPNNFAYVRLKQQIWLRACSTKPAASLSIHNTLPPARLLPVQPYTGVRSNPLPDGRHRPGSISSSGTGVVINSPGNTLDDCRESKPGSRIQSDSCCLILILDFCAGALLFFLICRDYPGSSRWTSASRSGHAFAFRVYIICCLALFGWWFA